jgi:3-hydroxyisobutyrate dehydrogenase-like beta-hydroxyacid dehydrogenase
MNKIGVLHPGEMGISIAASALNSGHLVYWVSAGRSEQTRIRAAKHNLVELPSLKALCQTCEEIISICPPHAAEEVASSVIAQKFKGIYLDANAISPQRAKKLAQIMEENKIRFVDGSVIGGPAWKQGETFLYLSGKDAEVIKDCFQNGPLETRMIGEEVGRASALKMCYAAYSKGTTGLLISILATAEALGVRNQLYQQWEMDDPTFPEQVERRVFRTTSKAWRFAGEMEEIAATFEEAGLPGGFHEVAAEVFRRMAGVELERPDQLDRLLAALQVKQPRDP